MFMFEESGGGSFIRIDGKEVFYPGCPRKAEHQSRFLSAWAGSYRWLKLGKTPMDLGWVTIDELDPRWFDFIELLDAQTARLEKKTLDEARRNRP
jgi:hypothetical protein